MNDGAGGGLRLRQVLVVGGQDAPGLRLHETVWWTGASLGQGAHLGPRYELELVLALRLEEGHLAGAFVVGSHPEREDLVENNSFIIIL